jgi:hypothetical protein
MATMRELSQWIREYGREPRHQDRLISDRFIWHQIWVAMDIIDDVESATNAYLNNEFPTDIGERYLRVYGVLQALFLQQDALYDLIKAIHPSKKIELNDVLKGIREVRNSTVGHPTQLRRGGSVSVHGIVQNSMTKDGFEMLSYPSPDESVFRYVPVRALISNQREETERILTEVATDLREQDENYRAKFRDVKLLATFNLAGYAFEKIFEGFRRDSAANMSPWGIGHLQTVLNDFERLLEQRGISLDTYDTTEYLYKGIAHPLRELTKFISREPSEILSDNSATVFAEALQGNFDRLRSIAREIDEEYASEPNPIILPDEKSNTVVITTTMSLSPTVDNPKI